MARLERSAKLLFGTEPPAAARELVLDHARGVGLGRLRLDVAPRGDGALGAEAKVADVDEATVFPTWERAVTLAPVEVAGGIGAHKWSDRRLLEREEANCAPALPLIVDSDETVLEVSRGNVLLVREGALITPGADGRMLPGLTRQRIFDGAISAGIELREEPVSLEALARADEVLVSGSVRGVEPVRACEGVGEWEEGRLTRSIAADLRRLWLSD